MSNEMTKKFYFFRIFRGFPPRRAGKPRKKPAARGERRPQEAEKRCARAEKAVRETARENSAREKRPQKRPHEKSGRERAPLSGRAPPQGRPSFLLYDQRFSQTPMFRFSYGTNTTTNSYASYVTTLRFLSSSASTWTYRHSPGVSLLAYTMPFDP